MFKCASWGSNDAGAANVVRMACCRALSAAAQHKIVRCTLASTKDCLLNLLATLVPFDGEVPMEVVNARTQAVMLLGCLLPERTASDVTWTFMQEKDATSLLNLLLQGLESEQQELETASLYCLSQLSQSILNKKRSKEVAKNENFMEVLDNVASPCDVDSNNTRDGGGDSAKECQPDYMVEEMCKALTKLYQSIDLAEKNYHSAQDDRWSQICVCLSALTSASRRARAYSVHRQFPRVLLASLQGVRDHLSLRGKPVEAIRNANNNQVLRTLHLLLTVMTSVMVDCQAAKESFAEDNIALSLNRLWPWCMTTEQLREAIVYLLLTYTNECPKAWASMCVCVSAQSLVQCVCALCSREAALASRARSPALLAAALCTLRHCLPHQQCRATIIKSEVLTHIDKSRVRVSPGPNIMAVLTTWARTIEVAARYSDSVGPVLAIRLTNTHAALRPILMTALAHAAHHSKLTMLHSSDVLEQLSGTLLTGGDPTEVAAAGRAIWALAANNHKAKLQLRSAGVMSAVQSALRRLERATDASSQRVIQLLKYTNTVLNST